MLRWTAKRKESPQANGLFWERLFIVWICRPWSLDRPNLFHNLRVTGMLHGRVVRPPCVGATLISVDEQSVEGLPGLVKVVVKKDFVGVVAEKALAGDPKRPIN